MSSIHPAEYEIVEINGLTVKRRKTTIPPPPSSKQLDASNSEEQNRFKTPHQGFQDTSGKVQRSPNVEEFEISEHLYDKLSTSLLHAANKAPEDVLVAVCGAVCDAELEAAAERNQPYLRDVLKRVFDKFLKSIEEATKDGSLRCANLAPKYVGVDSDAEDLHVDLEARKAGLRNRLSLLQEEERQWNSTFENVQSMDMAGERKSQNGSVPDPPDVSAYAGEEIHGLRSLKEDLPRVITQQVDGLEMMIKHMEEIIARNGATVEEVKSGLTKKRFQPFKYINSPQKLVKLIAKPPSPTIA